MFHNIVITRRVFARRGLTTMYLAPRVASLSISGERRKGEGEGVEALSSWLSNLTITVCRNPR